MTSPGVKNAQIGSADTMLWDLTLDDVGNPEDVLIWVAGERIGLMNPHLWLDDIVKYCDWILETAAERSIDWLWQQPDAGRLLDASLFREEVVGARLAREICDACYLKLDLPRKLFAVTGPHTRVFLVDGDRVVEHRLPNGAIERVIAEVRDYLVDYQRRVNAWKAALPL